MPNVFNPNPDYPDLFLGISESAGEFPNEKTGEKVKFHNFIVDLALSDREVTSNTVSSCGFECLGFTRTSVGDSTKFTDKRKIKADDISKIFGAEISTAEQLKDKVFQNCEVLWDKSGNIKRITFETPVTAPLRKK
ncbi:MAG: hypothetical protein NC253_01455 [Ruminococcus sp.]|nr:hypothetical protein [Ruminococcus sp.]MCM1381169.1 hypothetical protein [Muribaculaceae bacterium]MCM1479660.1 hypothetical protein [Muribaculaceae bacterium]